MQTKFTAVRGQRMQFGGVNQVWRAHSQHDFSPCHNFCTGYCTLQFACLIPDLVDAVNPCWRRAAYMEDGALIHQAILAYRHYNIFVNIRRSQCRSIKRSAGGDLCKCILWPTDACTPFTRGLCRDVVMHPQMSLDPAGRRRHAREATRTISARATAIDGAGEDEEALGEDFAFCVAAHEQFAPKTFGRSQARSRPSLAFV
jgi:hypothetical protein